MFYSTTEEEIEVEFINKNGEKDYRYIDVQIDVKGKYVDLSFSHEFGVERKWGWEEVEITWDESLYSKADNKIIKEYVEENDDMFIDYLNNAKDSWC
jgi:hypothetical protein